MKERAWFSCFKITSYINNLHPQKERVLYDLISKLIDVSIPLWDITLAPVAQDFYFGQRVYYNTRPKYEDVPETEGPQQADDEDDEDFMERRFEWVKENGKLILPDVELPFKPLMEPKNLSLRK